MEYVRTSEQRDSARSAAGSQLAPRRQFNQSEGHPVRSVSGVFMSLAEADRVLTQLTGVGIPQDRFSILTPHPVSDQSEDVPTTAAERQGIGKVIGGVVGGASGLALAATLLPGVGTVATGGLIVTALFGAAGTAAGAGIAGALEDSMSEGLPKDELFVYEDALRQGRTVLIVLTDGDAQANLARDVMREAGAESIDAARERWWIGLRDAEREHYAAESAREFEEQEKVYRSGFEAALSPQFRARSYEQAQSDLAWLFPEIYRESAFRTGFTRGQAYQQEMEANCRALTS
jgi:hypothetical protein